MHEFSKFITVICQSACLSQFLSSRFISKKWIDPQLQFIHGSTSNMSKMRLVKLIWFWMPGGTTLSFKMAAKIYVFYIPQGLFELQKWNFAQRFLICQRQTFEPCMAPSSVSRFFLCFKMIIAKTIWATDLKFGTKIPYFLKTNLFSFYMPGGGAFTLVSRWLPKYCVIYMSSFRLRFGTVPYMSTKNKYGQILDPWWFHLR